MGLVGAHPQHGGRLVKVKTWSGGHVEIAATDLKSWRVYFTSWAAYLWWQYRQKRARTKAMNKKRQWRAVSPYGSVDLGYITEKEAVDRAAGFGAVSHVDWQNAIVFYGTQSGGPAI